MIRVPRSIASGRSGSPGAEAPQDPLGREADRRQRVLDLVGDAPRDLAPGGELLLPRDVRRVLERQHPAAPLAAAGARAAAAPRPRGAARPARPDSTSSRGAAGRRARPRLLERAPRAARDPGARRARRPSPRPSGRAAARAAGLQTVIWPSASNAMTPVVTDSSTVEKRRRSSSRRRLEAWSSSFECSSAPRASSSPAAMRLKDSTSTASSSVAGTSTRAEKSPERSRPGRGGRARRSAR